jgi:hypothetical protein
MLAGSPSGVAAQGVDDLRPGAKVRLYPKATCPSCSVTGRLELLEGRRLELMVDEELLSFPLDSIRALEVSRGKSWVPPVVGGVGGFVVATGTFLAIFCSDPDTSCDGESIAVAALIIGAPVGAIGTLVGLLLADERWEDLPLERLGVVVSPGGIALQLSL